MLTRQTAVCTQKDISYIDIPGVDFFSNYPSTKGNFPFLRALKCYKRLDSTLKNLEKRILLLKNLKTTLTTDDPYLQGILKNIDKKTNHLLALKNLFDIGVLRDQKELYNPELEACFQASTSDLLSLKNDYIYDHKINRMFGLYVLEAIDPAHRFGLHTYVHSWKNSASKLPFFLYLEKHCYHDDIPQILYYSDEELKKFHICASDQRLHYHASSAPLSTDPRKEFIFILNQSDQLYGTYGNRTIRHTSLSRGDPLKSAGFLKIKKGIVQSIGLNSGHYFPTTDSLIPLATYFQTHDIPIQPDTPVHYYEDLSPKVKAFKELYRC